MFRIYNEGYGWKRLVLFVVVVEDLLMEISLACTKVKSKGCHDLFTVNGHSEGLMTAS